LTLTLDFIGSLLSFLVSMLVVALKGQLGPATSALILERVGLPPHAWPCVLINLIFFQCAILYPICSHSPVSMCAASGFAFMPVVTDGVERGGSQSGSGEL
jgi:hypothetical protein